MSEERGDCEHGHAKAVMELAVGIGRDHGMHPISAALVMFDPNVGVPTVIGSFNTSSLGTMEDAVLSEAAKHVPDGCENCDPMGKACALAAEVLRHEFHRLRTSRRKN